MGYALNATINYIKFIGLVIVSVVLSILFVNIAAYLTKFSLIFALIFYMFFIAVLIYGMNKTYTFFERLNKV